MMALEFRFCWGQVDAAVAHDARAFWRELDGALEEHEFGERSAELCAVAYSVGKIVAVSTARLGEFPRLGGMFAFYRTAVAPAFRRQKVAERLCAYSRDRLAEWAKVNPEVKVKGLLITFQSDELFRDRRHRPIIVAEGVSFMFVGYGEAGRQVRVVWFDDAVID